MKTLTLCAAAVKKKKAKFILGAVGKRTDNKTVDFAMPLVKFTLQPPLKYCVQFWLPPLKRDTLERYKV